MEILNLFFVPIITVYIYYKRSKKNINKIVIAKDYVIISVLVVIFAYIAMKILQALTGMRAEVYSQLYTIVSSIVAFALPYAYEIYKKYIDIQVEIKARNDENK